MQISEAGFLVQLLLVSFAFYLFVLIISMFGFFFFFYIKKLNGKDWDINFFESFLICFLIGLTIYISICFILDIFQFFNIFSAYYSIVIFDTIFLWYLIYRGKINKGNTLNVVKAKVKEFLKNPRKTMILIIFLIIILSLQIWIQWEIITREYAISSKDTYVWLGQTWYLIERGYLWRDHLSIHYPKGYSFYLAAPELIYPDYRFTYLYMKFGGIPFFCFYTSTIAIILKRNFAKNYMVLIGLSLVLLSNYLFTRFNSFVSSSICALLITISIIILRSKCPFYLTGFILAATFLLNSLLAVFYTLALLMFLFIKWISEDQKLTIFLTNFVGKTLVLSIILVVPYILHAFLVQNLSIVDYISLFSDIVGLSLLTTPETLTLDKPDTILIQLRYILRDLFPGNYIIYDFLDLERRILSYFLIFTLISLFFPTKKFFNGKNRDLINFAKISLIIIIIFYGIDLFFSDYSNVFSINSAWFKSRTVEAFAGPLIILTCFPLEKIIDKSKVITLYIENHYKVYRNLIKRNHFLKLFRIENIVIFMILISIFSTSIANRRIYYSYYFEKDQIDTIFYIKENIPEDSNILVADLGDKFNFYYNLLSTYDYYIWDFEFSENTFNETLAYIIKKDIEYILLDCTLINSTEKGNFTNYSDFDERYENDHDIVFKVKI